MGNSESTPLTKTESKVIGGTVGGATCAACVGTGIGLMFLGPPGMIAGGVLLGAGISSGVSTVQQCTKDENFNYDQWGTSVGIGALGGAVAAPLSVAGGVAASAVSGTVARVGTVMAAEVAGGALSGGVTSTVSKAANGEDVSFEDFAKGALVGGIAGAVGGASGQAASKLASAGSKAVGSVGSVGASGVRLTVGAAGGAAGGAGSAALATLVENAVNLGQFKRANFMRAMKEVGVEDKIAEKLWSLLCDNNIVIAEEVKAPLPDSLDFPEELKPYREFIKDLIDRSLDITKGVTSAATQGAIVGGVSGIVSAGVKIKQQKKQVAQNAKVRGEQVKRGAQAGTIEAEAYARQNNKRVVIHHNDGSTTVHGSKSASKPEVHVKYDAKHKHYSPADASGKKLPVPLESHRPGDCFFEAITHTEGGNPRSLRQDVGKFISENPFKLKGTGLKELWRGGDYIGGERRVNSLPKSERRKVVEAISKNVPDKDRRTQLIRDFKRNGVHRLQGMNNKTFAKVVKHQARGENHIHGLQGDLEGYISMAVYDDAHGTAGSISHGVDQVYGPKGRDRVVFKPIDHGLEFVGYTPEHNYKDLRK